MRPHLVRVDITFSLKSRSRSAACWVAASVGVGGRCVYEAGTLHTDNTHGSHVDKSYINDDQNLIYWRFLALRYRYV